MADTYKDWHRRIEKEKKAHKTFRDQAEEAEKAARDDGDKKHAFNVWWGTCKVTRSAVYANRPKPDVRRRYQKPNRDEKELARLVERAIEYQVDSNNFDSPSQAVVKDYVESGIGIPRVTYDVEKQANGEDENGETLEEIVAQSVGIEHIPWRHFHWEPGKSWEAVDWIAFEAFKPRKEVEREYGVKIKAGKDEDTPDRDAKDYVDEVQLYEIWHKPTRKVYVMAASHPKMLDEREDKLNLTGFFPIPRPLFANLKSDELIPKPDYEFIRPQVEELNRVSQRIKSLVAQIKALGYYDSANKQFSDLMGSPDGTYKPIDGLSVSTEHKPNTGLAHVPMMEKIQVVRELEIQREQTKEQIYEVTGISDIVRGSSKASETATAQQIKGQWANVRLNEKTGDVARIWRDVFRMFAEIICEHFQPQILMLQTGVEITPQMLQIMQSDIGRSFAIDIETDSTLAKDDFEERQQTMELVDTLLAKMEQVLPAVQAGLLPVEFVQEALLMVVSKHKNGKQLEDAIMELTPHLQGLQQFQQQMAQMQQQLEQAGMAVQERDAQLQQAGKQIEGLQGELGKANRIELDLKRGELAIKDRESKGKFRKDMVEAEAQQIENMIIRKQEGLEEAQMVADIDKTRAEADKIKRESMTPMAVV